MIKFFDRQFESKLNVCSCLLKLFGVNLSTAYRLCSYVGVSPLAILKVIPIFKLREFEAFVFSNFTVERQLKSEYRSDIETKVKNGLYVGLRLLQSLPVRGQRTRSNARTAKMLRRV